MIAMFARERGRQTHALCSVGFDVFEPIASMALRRPEVVQAADMHRRFCRLHVQEAGVQRAQMGHTGPALFR